MKAFLDRLYNPTELQKLGDDGFRTITTLAERVSRGDCGAAEELRRLAFAAALELTYYCKTMPEMFEPAVRRSFEWPMLHSLHQDWVKENDAILKNLNLGADSGINITGKKRRFSFDPPANRIAIELHFVAQSLRRAPMDEWEAIDWITLSWTAHLPEKDDPKYERALDKWGQKGPGRFLLPLSKETAESWQKAVPSLFRLVYGAKFDGHPQLQDLRRAVLGSAKDNYGKVGGAGVVRKRMLQSVVQAFGAIAACNK